MRVRKYRIFDVGNTQDYFGDASGTSLDNKFIIEKVAKKSYLPANAVLLENIKRNPNFKVSFSISGLALEQFEKYAPEDSMTFDFLRVKMKDGNAVPLERLYEVLGRREITFQPEMSIGDVDTFNYNHLMNCLFNQRGMPDMKVKRSGSRMLVWRPNNITKENYVVSVDRLHHLVPEHLRNPTPVQVSEGWSAVKLVPTFQSDGRRLDRSKKC